MLRDLAHDRQQLRFTALFQRLLQLEADVEVIFHRRSCRGR